MHRLTGFLWALRLLVEAITARRRREMPSVVEW
jgi:hypothetical protein